MGCSCARNEERRHWPTERLVLHFIAQYVTACSVGRCICPAVLDPNPRLSRLGRDSPTLCGSTQLWFQLTSFSLGSPGRRRRDCNDGVAARALVNQLELVNQPCARDGIDAVHRTAKVMHRTRVRGTPRVRAHGRRGRCTLHTANLSRHIHNAARATGSFLGYYECVKTSYGRDAVPSRLSPSFTAFAVTTPCCFFPLPSFLSLVSPSVTSLGGISRGREVRGTG